MPSHRWDDPWDKKHGRDLDAAIRYCIDTWRTYGRIGSHGKEKYGTFRDHPYLWDGGIWSLFYPGYVWVRPGIQRFVYYTLDRYLTKPITKYTGLYKLGLLWQATVYNYAIQKMCRRYPEIVDELVSHLDGYPMVKPGLFGKVCGTTIHNKHWTSV